MQGRACAETEMEEGNALLSRGERGMKKSQYIPIHVGVATWLHGRVGRDSPAFAFQAAYRAILVCRCIALDAPL